MLEHFKFWSNLSLTLLEIIIEKSYTILFFLYNHYLRFEK